MPKDNEYKYKLYHLNVEQLRLLSETSNSAENLPDEYLNFQKLFSMWPYVDIMIPSSVARAKKILSLTEASDEQVSINVIKFRLGYKAKACKALYEAKHYTPVLESNLDSFELVYLGSQEDDEHQHWWDKKIQNSAIIERATRGTDIYDLVLKNGSPYLILPRGYFNVETLEHEMAI